MEEILHQLIGSLSYFPMAFIDAKWYRISSINSINSSGLRETSCLKQLMNITSCAFLTSKVASEQDPNGNDASSYSLYPEPLENRTGFFGKFEGNWGDIDVTEWNALDLPKSLPLAELSDFVEIEFYILCPGWNWAKKGWNSEASWLQSATTERWFPPEIREKKHQEWC